MCYSLVVPKLEFWFPNVLIHKVQHLVHITHQDRHLCMANLQLQCFIWFPPLSFVFTFQKYSYPGCMSMYSKNPFVEDTLCSMYFPLSFKCKHIMFPPLPVILKVPSFWWKPFFHILLRLITFYSAITRKKHLYDNDSLERCLDLLSDNVN